jgi:hypothetical protein
MHKRLLLTAIAVIATGVGTGVALADQPPLVEVAGQPFYFVGTCTGVGDVLLVNQSLARGHALLIVGGGGGVVHLDTRGAEEHANSECTLTGGGFSPDEIEPFDEPFTFPAFISGA